MNHSPWTPPPRPTRISNAGGPAGWLATAALALAVVAILAIGGLMDPPDESAALSAEAVQYAAGIEEGRRQAMVDLAGSLVCGTASAHTGEIDP